MNLEELSAQYRKDGIWTEEMENIQNSYILDNIEDIFQSFMKNIAELEMRFEDYIGLKKGLWQANHGFTRTSDEVKRRLKEMRK